MRRQGMSPAAFARTLGVADAQVSRWRRGQVVPTVQSLQRIADVFGVPRTTLDRLAGYPVSEEGEGSDPELDAAAATLRQLLESRVPQRLWPAYLAACSALAETLASSLEEMLAEAGGRAPAHNIGFRPTHGPESEKEEG